MGRTTSTLKILIIIWAFFYCSIIILIASFNLQDEINLINQAQVSVPKKKAVVIKELGKIREVSAYNAGDENQCDEDPCISASGDNVCQLLEQGINVCALNGVPFYTILKVDSLGECVVLDRTSSKYAGRVDWAMKKNENVKALKFGVKKLNIIITKKLWEKPLKTATLALPQNN